MLKWTIRDFGDSIVISVLLLINCNLILNETENLFEISKQNMKGKQSYRPELDESGALRGRVSLDSLV